MREVLSMDTPLTSELHPFITTILEERFLLPPRDIFPDEVWPLTIDELAVYLRKPGHEVRFELQMMIEESRVPDYIAESAINSDDVILDLCSSYPENLQELLSYWRQNGTVPVVRGASREHAFSAVMHMRRLGIEVERCIVSLTHCN